MVRPGVSASPVDVDLVYLDDDIARDGFPPPDFIKMKIESMEPPALRGMEQTLRGHRPALYGDVHGARKE